MERFIYSLVFIFSEYGSFLKFVPWIAKIFRFVNWGIVVWSRVQHHLPRSGSALTSPGFPQSANLSFPSSKTNYFLCVLPPLPWDKFLLLQASFRSEMSVADPTCSVQQQAGLKNGVGTWCHCCGHSWNHTYLETLFFFLLSLSLIQFWWIHWPIAGAICRSERSLLESHMKSSLRDLHYLYIATYF